MIRLFAVCLGLASLATPALTCPEPSEELIFHSCWGEARAELLLLPEDAPLPPPPVQGVRLVVTGAYTSREPRGEGLPAPVGFFVRDGELVNRNMSRMDGLLVVPRDGAGLELHDRARVLLENRIFNLREVQPRERFAERAVAAEMDALQSHLLIIDGRVDVRDQEDAPWFRRRVLFTGDDGFGVYETPDAVTLHEAARRLDRAYAPDMALNLDMGSYDFCLVARDGVERRCGVLGREQADKLSNLLVLSVE